MRSSISLVGVLLLVAASLMGCGSPTLSKAEVPSPLGSFPMTVTDDDGRPVTIRKAPATIVSLAPSNTEMLYALGLADRIIGVDDYSDYPAEAKQKQKVGGFAKTSIEKVVALSPDIIFAARIHAKEVAPELEKRGMTVFVVQPGTVDAVMNSIRAIGKITEKTAESDSLTGQLQKRLDAVTAKTAASKDKPRVFFELDPSLISAGPGTFVDDLIAKAGGANIASDAKTLWPQMSQEAILGKNPEVIILADHTFGETPEKVAARPGWFAISAVKTGRIVGLDSNLTNRPGPRVVDGLEIMAKAIHPELFK